VLPPSLTISGNKNAQKPFQTIPKGAMHINTFDDVRSKIFFSAVGAGLRACPNARQPHRVAPTLGMTVLAIFRTPPLCH